MTQADVLTFDWGNVAIFDTDDPDIVVALCENIRAEGTKTAILQAAQAADSPSAFKAKCTEFGVPTMFTDGR